MFDFGRKQTHEQSFHQHWFSQIGLAFSRTTLDRVGGCGTQTGSAAFCKAHRAQVNAGPACPFITVRPFTQGLAVFTRQS